MTKLLKPVKDMDYHSTSEQLVNILQTKTQNTNPLFFRVIVAYYFSVLASQMRTTIRGWGGSKSTIPINSYVIALAPSGSGKGHSTSLIENEVIQGFRDLFLEHTFPIIAEQHCEQLAIKRANRNGTDTQDELVKLAKDFKQLGALLFTFDSATTPAIKQMRQKLLMGNAGSCNLMVDEIGANLSGSIEPLITYLELYDKGLLKDKLIKSTTDNIRFERLHGYTPANMLLFGTPTKLLDGSKTEELFYELLEMGYARRCLFGYTDRSHKNIDTSVDDVIKQLFNTQHEAFLEDLNDELTLLANLDNVNRELTLPNNTIRLLVEYKMDCEKRSLALSDVDTVKKSELEHRYFKVLKLAGAYAFIDKSNEIAIKHIENAIKLIEDSGEAFVQVMSPQRPYVKLANYLANIKGEVTLADLDEDLPCFKGSKSQKEEMIIMATAWGYKNNIIIKKSYMESIMFLYADSIEETDLDKLIISYTNNPDMTTNYNNEIVPFDKLPILFKAKGYHWLNHHLNHNYRREENCLNGFNLLVLDVDGSCHLSTAQLLLKDYQVIYYTTKRHTENEHRFRIVLPLNYTLKLTSKEYKEFYNNVIKDIPFAVDEQCNQRSRKWLSQENTQIIISEGELFDALPYIPKSSKNEQREQRLKSQEDMDNLERWVINNTGDGNRNNMLLRYACILIDAKFSFDNIKTKVTSLNNKLTNKLDELELANTIFHTVAAKLANQGKL